MIKLNGVQPVWEKSIIDFENTTANLDIETPIKRELVFECDKPWEGEMHRYISVIKDEDKYKMYYLAHFQHDEKVDENDGGNTIMILNSFVCYAESNDAIHWVKPSLGIHEWNGSKDNNILLRSVDKPEEGGFFDNFCVFIDTNPACDPSEKYKALAYMNLYKLGAYVSADGIHFKHKITFDIPGHFDSQNVCSWDEKTGKYVAYVRVIHSAPPDDLNAGIRGTQKIVSDDFINWSEPEIIKFNDNDEYPLYTNSIRRYYRNPDIFVGFPVRYMERSEWNDSFEQLCGKEARLAKMKFHKRYSLTVTDCIFMCSRDDLHWDKYDEAIFRPGMEFEGNWTYGNCFNPYFMEETVGEYGNKEISLYVSEYYSDAVLLGNGKGMCDKTYRYTFRRDGFASFKAKYSGAKVVTKPFVFEGDELYINFSTSARGSVYITIKDSDGNTAKTCELFGDSDERRVKLENALVSDFSGKTVTMEFEMKDAKLYSFTFR